MDPLTLLARDDKWFLGGGKGALYAPPFPRHLHSLGYWDESYLADVRLQRLFTSLFLDASGHPIRFTTRTVGWRPDRLEFVHTAPGILIRESRCVLECHAWVSEITIEQAPGALEMFVWSLQDLRPFGYGAPWSSLVEASVVSDSIGFRFDTAWPNELEPDRTAVEDERLIPGSGGMLPPLPVHLRIGCDLDRVSHTVNLAQRHDDSPLWETSMLPEKFCDGRLPGDFKLRVGPGEPEGLVHLVQHYRLAAGDRAQVFACAGLSPQSADASFEFCRSVRCVEESERAWRRYFAGVPQFSSSDPWLTSAYWYRWYGLRLNTVDMPDLPIRATGFQPVSASAFQAEGQGRSAPESPDQRLEASDTHRLEGGGTREGGADVDPIRRGHGAYLPHWTREGATYAVRFRLADAVPSHVREEWRQERELIEELETRGELTPAQRIERHRLHQEKIDAFLDAGSGSCVLRDPRAAAAVQSALKHFDGERHRIHAWCVMPNHVHVLIEPLGANPLGKILHSWKSYTSNEINGLLGRSGQLWLKESYDHIVRDADDYENQKAYIASNPQKAGLSNWEWVGWLPTGAPEESAFQPHADGLPRATGFQPVSASAFQAEDQGRSAPESPDQRLEASDTHRLEGGGTFSPFVTEGIGFFRNFVTYSAQAHLREVAWMHDPRLAVGILENLGKCQRADGSFPGHNYSCRPARDFYHADFATGISLLKCLHGESVTPSNVWPALERYAHYFLDNRSVSFPDKGRLFLVFDQNETGQEYMSRYTEVAANADQWASFRVCGVDASTYISKLLALLTWHHRADRSPRNYWRRTADEVQSGLATLSWNEADAFFCDVLPDGTQSRARPATGLYPVLGYDPLLLWHDQGLDFERMVKEWIAGADRFGLPKGFPADVATDATFSAVGEWKQKRLNCPWNGRSWPMVNSHIVDVAAEFARLFDRELGQEERYRARTDELRNIAAVALMKAIKLMFHDDDPSRPNSYEHYNPITGRPALYRGYDDYMHSWIVDLILRHAVGVQPGQDDPDPLPLDVDWIECTDIPHPQGRMHVRIEKGQIVRNELERA